MKKKISHWILHCITLSPKCMILISSNEETQKVNGRKKWKILEVKCVLTSIFLLWNIFFFILVKITPLLQCIKCDVVEDPMHQKKDLLSSIFFLFCFWEQTNNRDRKVYVDIEEHESWFSVCTKLRLIGNCNIFDLWNYKNRFWDIDICQERKTAHCDPALKASTVFCHRLNIEFLPEKG